MARVSASPSKGQRGGRVRKRDLCKGAGRREEGPREEGGAPAGALRGPARHAVAAVPGSHGVSLLDKPSVNLGYFAKKW